MKENGRMADFTERELRHCLMGLFSMEIGRRVALSDKGCASILMAPSILEAGTTASLTESESKFYPMGQNIPAIGWKARQTDRELRRC